jgi:hypothetical protein
MNERTPAVFVSYASQDAGPARRICEALRDAGIEVWFDQSELRGGDAWDQRIRQQIRECTLFIPVISMSTQSRLEGYFRREWRLGVDRTLDMADGKPFLVPVAIDDTPDRNAHVPEAFRAVQWTRLPAGETSPDFVQRVARLLESESPLPTTSTLSPARAHAPAPARRHVSKIKLAIGVAILIGVGYFLFGLFQTAQEDAIPPAPPVAPTKSASPDGTAEKPK